MNKLLKGILTGLCAIAAVTTAGAAVSNLPSNMDVETAYAETTYTTKDIAMLGRVAGWYGNGNFEIRFTLGELDHSGDSIQKTYGGELRKALADLDFFNHIVLAGKTLAEWGCTACYDNWYKLNSGEPDYTLTIPLAMSADSAAAASEAGAAANAPITILEGALLPSDAYLQGDATATVYRAGCEYVTSNADVDYGIMAIGKTEVESLQYVTGWDSTYNNAYLGVSLKGDDYVGNGQQTERAADYGSSVYMSNHFSNKLLADGVGGKAEQYGLFNLGQKGQGYFSFVFRAQEEETESITIPAGTMFPSFAMVTLQGANNGNRVYVMYETQTDVTFYKQADGTWQKPMQEKQTDIASVTVAGSEADNFTVFSLTTHDYPDSIDNYGGKAVGTKAFLANTNFFTNVLIDDVAIGSTGEAYLNIWGNKGAIGIRTSAGLSANKITVLAGCQLPTYAALENGAREMYVTTEDVTFVKNSEGVFVKAADEFTQYVEEQKSALDAYLAGSFREAEEAQRLAIIAQAKANLDQASDKDAVDAIVTAAKAEIDSLKTANEYAEEELAAAKTAANSALEAYKADEVYFEEQSAARLAAINAGKEAVAVATTVDGVNTSVAEVKAAIDGIATKSAVIAAAKAEVNGYKAEEGYFLAEEAAQRAVIVETANDEIDNATTQAAVNQLVANAKAAIDALTPAYEYYTTKDIAMLGRVAGWYGNGNFEIRITLGEADWTNEDNGQKAYDGQLKDLLAKFDFFNKIMLAGKTLAEWGCTACYDNIYWLNSGEPDYTLTIPLAMSKMDEAAAAGAAANAPITILKGALIPSYGYLSKTGNVVYSAGCDFVTSTSEKAYGMEVSAKTEVNGVKYVQGHDGNCGYFGISFAGDDYLGDGTQLEVDGNYAYDNRFETKILVNGEAGKVGQYGLFNLGSKGQGYFSFAMYVAEEDLVSITIPAGTKFPSRAMSTLRGVNGNPVYVMYEVVEEITFYKTEDGFVPYSEYLAPQLDGYKAGLFREAEEAQRVAIIEEAKAQILATTVKETIDAIYAAAKAEIDGLKTAAQYADEELAAVKNTAIATLEAYKADEVYFEEQAAARLAAINAGKEAVANAATEDAIAAAVVEAKAVIDGLATKAAVVEDAKNSLNAYKAEDGYFKAEEAAQRATIVETANDEIDNATTKAAVDQLVANAKAAIDALKAAYEYYETMDVAMMGRVAGWHGNGNFEIRISLGASDWTAEDNGQKSYDGQLKDMLVKLDFFNKIMLAGKTLAEWGCTACYDNIYWLGNGGPQYTIMIPLTMSKDNMTAATGAGAKADAPITILEGALIPGYGYLSKTGNVVYRAGADYVTVVSEKAYGIEATAKVEVESVKYVQGHDGNCGYFGVSFVGDDYLGDGTQLEVNNTNYHYDNRFETKILVNDEAGKVGSYGLFNLGSKGQGYFSFAMYVTEEDLVSITIPAGTKFPARAMTTLFAVNNNPVYIMYEVAEEITLYKTANGFVSYDEYVVAEVESYKAGMFREAEEAMRLEIVAIALNSISEATNKEGIDLAVAKAKEAIDALKTAAQYADEELAELKATAVAEIEAYKADGNYYVEQVSERANAVLAGKELVALAATEAEIQAAVAQAKALIDAVATKDIVVEDAKNALDNYKAEEGYFREEQAAQRATIIEEAKAVIDNATTQTEIANAVAGAKAAIDKLVAASEYYVTKEVAMMGRVAGWHGNGNFEIRITLSEKDWDAENGQYSYEGELAQLLNKLDFFNKIVLAGKTLAEWGCTACYDNIYWIGNGGPQNTVMLPMTMSKDNMTAATQAGAKADAPITILEGALIPGYGYLSKTGDVVYEAGCDYVTIESTKAYGIETSAKTEVEDLKYVQGFDGTCGYIGISLVGDDYLGDGSQLEVDQNYWYDYRFDEMILVNGEAGLVGYYGLFNLGENGVGYYAFQIFMAEEEIVSITIPAGTKFPARAMTTLFAVNGNPVYIMYEVVEEITLYKTANGFGSYAGSVIPELENYKAGLFREAEEAQRLAIIDEAKFAISVAESKEAIDLALEQAKAAIDDLKTAAQYADEELAEDKATAVAAIEGYKANVAYLAEQAAAKAEIIVAAKTNVANAATLEEIQAAVTEAQTAIDALNTKEAIVAAAKVEVEGYKTDVVYLEAQATEKATVVATAVAAIEAATSEAMVNEAVSAAKAAIDEIKTAEQVAEDSLNAKKAQGNTQVDDLKKAIDFDLYDDEAIATINSLYSTAKNAIKNATTEDEVDNAVTAFASALAEVPQKDNGGNSSDVEDPTTSDEPTTSEDPATSEDSNGGIMDKLGCSSGINAITFGVIALGLGVMKLCKKKED